MKIIAISCDTLRADHLGAYGYSRPTSPTLDRIAGQGVLFEQAIAADIPTEAAHTAIFTGRFGIHTGVVAHGAPRVNLAKSTPWLPALLRQAGLTTAAVDNLYNLKEWFARGYQFYVNTAGRQRWIDGADVNARAIPWLRQHASEDFFLFLHYWDPHTPYMPPEQYRRLYYSGNPHDPAHRSLEPARRQPVYPFFHKFHYELLGGVTDAAYLSALYDAEIRYLDDLLSELDDALATLGIAEETLLVVFGDHGESLDEHDIYWDHAGLYEATVHVPLILRWPSRIPAGRRVAGPVQHVDLFPTLLEAAGQQAPAASDGKTLWPLIRGEGGNHWDRVYLSECSWQATRAVRTAEWKLIKCVDPGLYVRPRLELYNLRDDPGETVNLAEREPERAAQMERELLAWVDQQLGPHVDPMHQVLSTTGIPAEERLNRTLAAWNLTWREWVRDPDLRRLGL